MVQCMLETHLSFCHGVDFTWTVWKHLVCLDFKAFYTKTDFFCPVFHSVFTCLLSILAPFPVTSRFLITAFYIPLSAVFMPTVSADRWVGSAQQRLGRCLARRLC